MQKALVITFVLLGSSFSWALGPPFGISEIKCETLERGMDYGVRLKLNTRDKSIHIVQQMLSGSWDDYYFYKSSRGSTEGAEIFRGPYITFSLHYNGRWNSAPRHTGHVTFKQGPRWHSERLLCDVIPN